MEISLMVEGQLGLNWARWRRLVAEADGLGIAGFYRSDHFTDREPPDQDSLELIVSLAYLADHTERVALGPLVAPITLRDPIMLARQAAALDALSGGRMVLGVGAGWQEREHRVFGYPLRDVPARMDRLGEALEVMTRLLRTEEPVSFEGEYFRLADATLLPRPERQPDRRYTGPPILVGGSGPRRTLPLVARYAEIWNSARSSPEQFAERSALLDRLLEAEGRQPHAVKRTMFTSLTYATDAADLDRALDHLTRQGREYAGMGRREVLDGVRAKYYLAGTPEMLAEQLAPYAGAGVEEMVLRWTELDDLDRLRDFGARVPPLVA